MLLPYKMQLSRSLSEDGIASYCAFANDYRALMEDNPGVLNVTRFSSEAHFHMDAYTETQEPLEEQKVLISF
jgi:hypothetical protein